MIVWFEGNVGYGLNVPECILLLRLWFKRTGFVYRSVADSLSVCVLNCLPTPLGLPGSQQHLPSKLCIVEYMEFTRLQLLATDGWRLRKQLPHSSSRRNKCTIMYVWCRRCPILVSIVSKTLKQEVFVWIFAYLLCVFVCIPSLSSFKISGTVGKQTLGVHT